MAGVYKRGTTYWGRAQRDGREHRFSLRTTNKAIADKRLRKWLDEMEGTGEIPADILKSAEDALDNMLCNCRESCGSHEAVRAESIKDIARALLAERERCAEIAERFPGAVLHFSDRPYDKPSEYRAATSADIAKAIRS